MNVKENIELVVWPPDYRVKKHPRAKYVKFRVTRRDGLEVITPLRFNQKNIPGLLEKHKPWITDQLRQLITTKKQYQEEPLPQEISLLSVNKLWKVEYIKIDGKRLQFTERLDNSLVFYGNLDSKLIFVMLQRWIKQKAREYLKLELDQLCEFTKFNYGNLTIRAQRGRWGSCTNKKSLSLNFKLLFLPRNLMRHVLLHELCHTVHMNHSEKFWNLVAQFDSAWQEHEKLLKRSEHWIPGWVD